MAIKKGIQRPEDKKNTPNDPGRQAVPQRPADKKATRSDEEVRGRYREEFNINDPNISESQRKMAEAIRRRRGGSSDTEGILRREFQRAHTKK